MDVKIIHTTIKNDNKSLSETANDIVSGYERDFGLTDAEIKDGKFGEVDAKIVTGSYISKESNLNKEPDEKFQLNTWIFPDKDTIQLS